MHIIKNARRERVSLPNSSGRVKNLEFRSIQEDFSRSGRDASHDRFNPLVWEVKEMEDFSNKALFYFVLGFLEVQIYDHDDFFAFHLLKRVQNVLNDDGIVISLPSGNKIALERRYNLA